jgi:hypothetical protein
LKQEVRYHFLFRWVVLLIVAGVFWFIIFWTWWFIENGQRTIWLPDFQGMMWNGFCFAFYHCGLAGELFEFAVWLFSLYYWCDSVLKQLHCLQWKPILIVVIPLFYIIRFKFLQCLQRPDFSLL